MGKSYVDEKGERRCDACQGKMPETNRRPNAGYLAGFVGVQHPAEVVTRTCEQCGAVEKIAEQTGERGGRGT